MKKIAMAMFVALLFAGPVRAAQALSPAEEKLNQGAAAMAAMNYDDAVKSFQDCLELLPAAHPLRANAYLQLGTAYANEGDYEKAIGAFESSILADPLDPMAHLFLGRAFRLQEEPIPALVRFLEAARLAPDLAPVQDELWQTYEDLGEHYGYDKEIIADETYHIERTLEIDDRYAKAYPDIYRKLKALFILDRRLAKAPSGSRIRRESGSLVPPGEINAPRLPDDGIPDPEKAAAFQKAQAR